MLLFLILYVNNAFSQEKLTTKNGKILFEATVPSFEEVKATNDGVTAVLNLKTGEFASLALIKGFHFKVALWKNISMKTILTALNIQRQSTEGRLPILIVMISLLSSRIILFRENWN